MSFWHSGKKVTSPGFQRVAEEGYVGFSLCFHGPAAEKKSGAEEGWLTVCPALCEAL